MKVGVAARVRIVETQLNRDFFGYNAALLVSGWITCRNEQRLFSATPWKQQ